MSTLEMHNKVKHFKLNILQYRYKYLTDIILNLEKHIDYLFINNNLEFIEKNQLLGKLFTISKNLNTSYNTFILEKLEINCILDNKILELLCLFNNEINEDYIFSECLILLKQSSEILPLMNHEKELMTLISECGYINILELIKIYNNFELSPDQNILINELLKVFIPIKINTFNVSNKTDNYYWRFPLKYGVNDLLELGRELWIKNINSTTEYLKIEGYFINDTLSCYIKTSQINYSILHKIKAKILLEINNSLIDINFLKKFMRYDYLGNMYCLTSKNYITYIEKSYHKFLELTNSTFVNIMKEFISNGSEIKKMNNAIFLLLLGNSDNADISGLLLGLTKEKKTNSPFIYNLICQRLPYYLLVKIKKSNNNIKAEIEKIKTLTCDDVDYKKQLLINKNIPPNIKSLTLEKIEEMKSNNNEYYKQLTFVKHILNYPWSSSNDDIFFKNINKCPNKSSEYLIDIENKLKKLSYGHEQAKKGLLQTIGKWISNPSSQGTCFGLVGPPGVGKTLLAKSVSKALDIPFAEITLGGQNDGEILHGHGYTYSGSQPGLIIKKMVDMGKSRCILYFDELDKACSKHGSINEITSILIHLTDPNMNKTFQDRFFQGVDFPLDKVIMIFSYNDPNLVDPILLDRLKQIEVNTYTTNDKIKIVKEFIIPEIAESVGLINEKWIHINNELIEFIIENYTSEAGVRSIKRQIEHIFLTLNLERFWLNSKNNSKNEKQLTEITKETIIRILDSPKNDNVKIHETSSIGIINGLYATVNGDGGVIPIQIFNNFSPNTNYYEIKLTGKQGDVMKESVHCSLTAAIDYIKRNLNKYFPTITNIEDHLIQHFKYGFHVHTPSTSTPKDGPSAGCAFTSAFISRILNKPIRNDIAMTGEVELTGKITKIGGLNFKLIGAKKAGVKLVFVPKENINDIDDIKKKYPLLIDSNFNIKYFEYIDEIIDEILL
jgi:endopeptidase La